jgi:hypothetical protein
MATTQRSESTPRICEAVGRRDVEEHELEMPLLDLRDDLLGIGQYVRPMALPAEEGFRLDVAAFVPVDHQDVESVLARHVALLPNRGPGLPRSLAGKAQPPQRREGAVLNPFEKKGNPDRKPHYRGTSVFRCGWMSGKSSRGEENPAPGEARSPEGVASAARLV